MPGDDENVGNGYCENLADVIISCFNFLKIVTKQYILGLPNIVMLFFQLLILEFISEKTAACRLLSRGPFININSVKKLRAP